MKELAEFLLKAPAHQQKAVLQTLTVEQLKFMVEIIFNAVKGTTPLADDDKRILYRRRQAISKLLARGITIRQRKQRLLALVDVLLIFIQSYLQYGS